MGQKPKRKRKKFIVRGSRRKSFTARLKPHELKTREEQMKDFRYQCAKVTGNLLYFCANLYISGIFVIFVTMWLVGMYEGTQIIHTFNESYSIWNEILTQFVPVLAPVSIMLAVSVKILSFDAKGRIVKTMKIATDRSMYFLILVMASISVLYFDKIHWHI